MDEQMNVSETVVEPKAEEETVNQVETGEKKVKKMDKETVKKIIKDAVSPENLKKNIKNAVSPENLKKNIKNAVSPENLKKTICSAMAFAVFIVGMCYLFMGNNPKSIAMSYVEADILTDMKAEAKYLAYDKKEYEENVGFMAQLVSKVNMGMYDLLSIVMNEEIEDWADYVKVSKEQRADELEKEYGEYKIEISVKKEKKLTVEELLYEKQKFINTLEMKGLIDSAKIKGAEVITVKSKIKGEKKTDTNTSNVYMCKINGSWKVLTTS